jgi:hypothetical protein
VLVKACHGNNKGKMREKPIHVGGYVQKSVQGDDKINEHYCIIGGAIPTITMCIRGM